MIDDLDCSFIEALKSKDLGAIRGVPKADLHNHAVFGGSREILKVQFDMDIPNPPRRFNGLLEMDEWCESCFPSDSRGTCGFRKKIAASLIQAGNDGVTNLLLNVGSCIFKYFNNATLFKEYVFRTARRYVPDVSIGLEYCIDCNRLSNEKLRLAQIAIESGVFVSLDAIGLEGKDPLCIERLYSAAHSNGIRRCAHLGEFGNANEIKPAIDSLKLNVIQHGLSAVDSSEAMQAILDNDICINVCPESNIRLGRASSYAMHPIRAFVDAGVKVTIASDDVLIFGSDVSSEYLRLYEFGTLTAEELNDVRNYGLKSAASLCNSI